MFGTIICLTILCSFTFGLKKEKIEPLANVNDYPIYGRDKSINEYYRDNFLDERQQIVYDNFLEALLQFKPRFYVGVEKLSSNELENICCYLKADHPEIFWFETYTPIEIGSKVFTSFNIIIHYRYDKDEAIEKHNIIKAKYEPIIEQAKKCTTDRKKVDFVKDKLEEISNACYPSSDELDDFCCMVSIFENGKSFCSGYAYSFKFIMDRLGIKAICVFYNGPDAHIWNMVMLNNNWYNLDITYDKVLKNAPKDKYYLVDNDTFYKDHHINEYMPNL